ncbi:AAA family ATPase [Streptomyces fulvorobeus]|uniref:Broad-specificity NMP kinase n=1 Tax=Streptomyces fulvorobeus TaxID=284028 RepID=A0A7J0C3Y5_9ACTN|nr:AAA family ATPase [Streptomyces fulvorobeus]NYE40885.1 broad-specificity NMP kinase [Streptomyces fulvorobeus]GFM97202.1 hypothetical protein Sfulv_20130 [Streptomyces fulvorobeus]
MTFDPRPVDREPAPCAVLLTGIPGSGKSTVAAAVAARLPKSAYIDVDALQDMIVGGGEWPIMEGSPEADRQIFLRARHACLLADSFVAAGFVPVLADVVVRRTHLAFYRETLRTGRFHVVVLAPDPGVAWERNRTRDKVLETDWTPLDRAMRAELGDAGTWIDTSGQSVEETVDAVLTATGLGPGRRDRTTAQPRG